MNWKDQFRRFELSNLILWCIGGILAWLWIRWGKDIPKIGFSANAFLKISSMIVWVFSGFLVMGSTPGSAGFYANRSNKEIALMQGNDSSKFEMRVSHEAAHAALDQLLGLDTSFGRTHEAVAAIGFLRLYELGRTDLIRASNDSRKINSLTTRAVDWSHQAWDLSQERDARSSDAYAFLVWIVRGKTPEEAKDIVRSSRKSQSQIPARRSTLTAA